MGSVGVRLHRGGAVMGIGKERLPERVEELPAEIQGAIAIARYWLYQYPGYEIPDREARVIARGLVKLAAVGGGGEA